MIVAAIETIPAGAGTQEVGAISLTGALWVETGGRIHCRQGVHLHAQWGGGKLCVLWAIDG